MTDAITISEKPYGDLTTRTLARMSDTNTYGDIFGGWLMAQMDIAGYLAGRKITLQRLATVAVDKIEFHHPVSIGDMVTCYTHLIKIGRTSLTVHVDVWVERFKDQSLLKVTQGRFIFVAVDANGRPTPVQMNS